ncbi:hypothetical protein PR048_030426 [Dryococelus australis]|uniref:Uncharacterized protein n=1 Tax=Dryococelus australis TaxID=614101 RepID=A0ABQ9G8Y5_9NEOP|nr:hypothetical protein PR048_030426 [Dryococelus australis]
MQSYSTTPKWLDHSPPTYANWVLFLVGWLPDFRMWELCLMMLLVGRFSLGSPFYLPPSPPILYSSAAPYSRRFALISTQDLVESIPCQSDGNHNWLAGYCKHTCCCCRRCPWHALLPGLVTYDQQLPGTVCARHAPLAPMHDGQGDIPNTFCAATFFWLLGPRWMSSCTARLPPRRTGFTPWLIHSGFSQVGIVLDDTTGRWVFLFPSHLHSSAVPYSSFHPYQLSRPRCYEPPKSLVSLTHSFFLLGGNNCTSMHEFLGDTVNTPDTDADSSKKAEEVAREKNDDYTQDLERLEIRDRSKVRKEGTKAVQGKPEQRGDAELVENVGGRLVYHMLAEETRGNRWDHRDQKHGSRSGGDVQARLSPEPDDRKVSSEQDLRAELSRRRAERLTKYARVRRTHRTHSIPKNPESQQCGDWEAPVVPKLPVSICVIVRLVSHPTAFVSICSWNREVDTIDVSNGRAILCIEPSVLSPEYTAITPRPSYITFNSQSTTQPQHELAAVLQPAAAAAPMEQRRGPKPADSEGSGSSGGPVASFMLAAHITSPLVTWTNAGIPPLQLRTMEGISALSTTPMGVWQWIRTTTSPAKVKQATEVPSEMFCQVLNLNSPKQHHLPLLHLGEVISCLLLMPEGRGVYEGNNPLEGVQDVCEDVRELLVDLGGSKGPQHTWCLSELLIIPSTPDSAVKEQRLPIKDSALAGSVHESLPARLVQSAFQSVVGSETAVRPPASQTCCSKHLTVVSPVTLRARGWGPFPDNHLHLRKATKIMWEREEVGSWQLGEGWAGGGGVGSYHLSIDLGCLWRTEVGGWVRGKGGNDRSGHTSVQLARLERSPSPLPMKVPVQMRLGIPVAAANSRRKQDKGSSSSRKRMRRKSKRNAMLSGIEQVTFDTFFTCCLLTVHAASVVVQHYAVMQLLVTRCSSQQVFQGGSNTLLEVTRVRPLQLTCSLGLFPWGEVAEG